MASDPFSDFLRVTRAHSIQTAPIVAGGDWAVTIPPPDGLKFGAVVRGRCWLRSGGKAAVQLDEGDVFLLAAPRTHLLASSLSVRPRPLADAARARRGAGSIQLGKGDDVLVLGGKVVLDGDDAATLLRALPPLIRIRASSPLARTLHWLMEQMLREQTDELPGADVASAQLAQLMFIQILRAYFASTERSTVGWLRAMSDRRLAPALRRMHAEPGRDWRLDELAHASAMSRATFAATFKRVAGVSPMAYLTGWRMRLAIRALREDHASVAELASTLGYASESAFSHAFKRVTGQSPRACRSQAEQSSRKLPK